MKFEEGYFTNAEMFTIMHLYEPDISILQDYNSDQELMIIKAYLQEKIVGYAIISRAHKILEDFECYDSIILASFIKELKRLKVKQFNGEYMDDIVSQIFETKGFENIGRHR